VSAPRRASTAVEEAGPKATEGQSGMVQMSERYRDGGDLYVPAAE